MSHRSVMVLLQNDYSSKLIIVKGREYIIRRFKNVSEEYNDIKTCFLSLPVKAIIQRYRYKIRVDNLLKSLDQAEHTVLMYRIRSQTDKKLVGWGELWQNYPKKRLEMGFLVHPGFWGIGIGTFIAQHLIAQSKDVNIQDIHQCVAFVQGYNPAARKIMDHIVKKYEGVRILNRLNNTIKYCVPLQ